MPEEVEFTESLSRHSCEGSATGDLLAGYRGLDLTNERGLLCGKMLADLGAEVIKVEPPRGDPARNIGPFYQDIPHRERSLFWSAFNVNKKGVTLNLESRDGQSLLRRLITRVDFLLESFDPGYLDGLGLGYEALKELNPDLIFTTITPYGQSGPYSHYEASDITMMAMGGYVHMTGEPDRPPVRISQDQAYLHAGSEAAVATMIALYQRGSGGPGQHIDVSAQASLLTSTVNAIPFWEMEGTVLGRSGPYRTGLTAARQRQLWECRGGYVIFYFAGGAFGVRGNAALAAWLEEEGLADDFLRGIDWETFDMALAGEEIEEHLEGLVSQMFGRYTSAELYDEALERGLTLCPVSTPPDIAANLQLAARGYWVEVAHDNLGGVFKYPGPAVKTPGQRHIWQRAPLVGEHNREIWQNELGLSSDQLILLKEAGAI